MLEIFLKSGEKAIYTPADYTDYKYDGKFFVVIRDNQWVGFYNLDIVAVIQVKPLEEV